MDTAQWPQEIVMKPMEEIVQTTKPSSSSSLERKIRPQKDKALNCPRCNSTNTKFCYYNNYSLTQPRYFCKTCRRYWTAGGSLRNIPVGGGSRKNKRSSSSPSSSSKRVVNDLVIQNPNKIHHQEGQDLNLGFPPQAHNEFKTFTELIQVPNYDKENNMPCSSSTTSSHQHLSAMELLTGITSSSSSRVGGGGGFCNSFLPISDPNTVFSSGFSLLPSDLKSSSLNFGLDSSLGNGGFGGALQSIQENNGGRLLFPFEDLKPVSNSTTTTVVTDTVHQSIDQSAADSNGYWSGVLGGATW